MAIYAASVFINCPFDEPFEPLLNAMVLTVSALGFEPRSARESEGTAEPRITRIAKGLLSSKFSIHDLSRYTGQGADNLARFNMPMELGMALGLRFERAGSVTPHNWVALVPQGFQYQSFISDLAGYDPPQHDGTETSIVTAVAGWLRLQSDFVPPAPSVRDINEVLPVFRKIIEKAKKDAGGRLSWPDILASADRALFKLKSVAPPTP